MINDINAITRPGVQSAKVAIDVEFDVPDVKCLNEDETLVIAETQAHIAALSKLWIALRLVGFDVRELIESIESP